MRTETISLSSPVEIAGERVATLTLKEPTGGMFLDLGEPRLLARNADGTLFWVEDKIAIKGYLEKIVEHKLGIVAIQALPLVDVRRVKEVLFGFFESAPATSSG